MNRFVIVALVASPLAACVTTGKYNEQVEAAQASQKQAGAAQEALDQFKKTSDQQKADLAAAQQQVQADKKTQDDLQARLKADDDQIAQLQKESKQLTEALESAKASKESGHEKKSKHK